MTTTTELHRADSAERASTMSIKRVSAGLAAGLAIAAVAAFSTPALASPTAAATTDTTRVEPLISERPCNSAELPRQIWLTSRTGPTRCFGGAVGGIRLGNHRVEWLSSGDYTGSLVCEGGTVYFDPATDRLLNRTCTVLNIHHGSLA